MGSGEGDREKARYRQMNLREAVRIGISIPEFCRQRRLKESRFYWWQRKPKAGREERGLQQRNPAGNRGSPALVSDEAGATNAGISWCWGMGVGCASGGA